MIRGHRHDAAVPGEVVDIERERCVGGRAIRVVQTHVSGDHVDVAIAVEIGRCDALPPARELTQTRFDGGIAKPPAIVAQERDGHPFAGNEQVWDSVGVDIGPARVRHGPQLGQRGRGFIRYVAEHAPLVMQQPAAGQCIGV